MKVVYKDILLSFQSELNLNSILMLLFLWFVNASL